MRTFLRSERNPWGVFDAWLNQGHPLGIFTVLVDDAKGDDWLSKVKGDHQGVWGLAIVDQVADRPAARLHEALSQSKRRQERRLGSIQPVPIWPLADATPAKKVIVIDAPDTGARHNVLEDHRAEVHPAERYGQDRHGQGRWVRLFRFGNPIATLWTDDAQSLGLIPEPGASVALLSRSIGSAYAMGTPASWVFDDHAAWASSQADWAGQVERGDLATLSSE
ncbi:MAG TPA: hypothetical protein VIJ15_09980 [Dermatophilaceae bacterium]